jgi:hypothetical protein
MSADGSNKRGFVGLLTSKGNEYWTFYYPKGCTGKSGASFYPVQILECLGSLGYKEGRKLAFEEQERMCPTV